MTINGISGANTQAAQIGMNQAMDSYSKNIQNQIANAQKQLQELSSNEEMTLYGRRYSFRFGKQGKGHKEYQ